MRPLKLNLIVAAALSSAAITLSGCASYEYDDYYAEPAGYVVYDQYYYDGFYNGPYWCYYDRYHRFHREPRGDHDHYVHDYPDRRRLPDQGGGPHPGPNSSTRTPTPDHVGHNGALPAGAHPSAAASRGGGAGAARATRGGGAAGAGGHAGGGGASGVAGHAGGGGGGGGGGHR